MRGSVVSNYVLMVFDSLKKNSEFILTGLIKKGCFENCS